MTKSIELQCGATSVSLHQRLAISRTTTNRMKASHFGILATTGIPTCSFVITRRLYKITRLDGPVVRGQQGSGFSNILFESEEFDLVYRHVLSY